MKQLSLILSVYLICGNLLGQKDNYCDWSGCHLDANDEAHFDPYYNGHLCENFDPKQVDFSQEYLKLQRLHSLKYMTDITEQMSEYSIEIDSLFNTGMNYQNGVIGLDYQRLMIHISKTEIEKGESHSYLINGKSNVKDNVCDFKGKIRILYVFKANKDVEYDGQGTLFAEYEFFEDTTQNHVGKFKGVFECSVAVDSNQHTIKFDDSSAIADGYHNRTYVGTWIEYKTNFSKKCIWGDYRLPFTFDFDCGDGEMHICDKYEKNGWQSINEDNYSAHDGWWE